MPSKVSQHWAGDHGIALDALMLWKLDGQVAIHRETTRRITLGLSNDKTSESGSIQFPDDRTKTKDFQYRSYLPLAHLVV